MQIPSLLSTASLRWVISIASSFELWAGNSTTGCYQIVRQPCSIKLVKCTAMVPDQLRGEYIYQLRIIDLLGTGFQKNGIQLLRGRKMQDPWQALNVAQKMNSSKIIVYSLAQTVAVMSVRGQPEGDNSREKKFVTVF